MLLLLQKAKKQSKNILDYKREGEKMIIKNWLIVDRRGYIVSDTDDLDLAWSICETTARCGGYLTVISKAEITIPKLGKEV